MARHAVAVYLSSSYGREVILRIRTPNASEVIAIIALIVASSGTAVAASRYLITSPSQIKPSVLRAIASSARGETAESHSQYVFSKPGFPGLIATARCPAGYEDVSGGYHADLPPEWHVATSQRFGDGWTVTANSAPNEHPSQQAKVQVIAYCRSNP